MIRRSAGVLAAGISLLVAAALMWADATVDVTVTDRATGALLAGAKIRAAGFEATTDAAGRARLRVPAGRHAVAAEHERYASEGRTVQVGDGETRPVALPLTVFQPRMFQDPPGWTLGVGPVFAGMWNGDLTVDRQTERVAARGLSSTASPAALRVIDKENHDLQLVGGKIDVRLGLPALDLPLGRLHPSFSLGAGGVHFRQQITLGPLLLGAPFQRFQLVGGGFFGTAGGGLTWALDHHWYVRAAGAGEFIPTADAGNSEHIPGASGSFSYRRAVAEGIVGRSFLDQQVGIYLGIARSWTWVGAEDVQPFPAAGGPPLRREMDLSVTRTQGIVGLDFQWVPRRFGGFFEWRYNQQDRFTRIGVTLAF